jgi:hypothetical protein
MKESRYIVPQIGNCSDFVDYLQLRVLVWPAELAAEGGAARSPDAFAPVN